MKCKDCKFYRFPNLCIAEKPEGFLLREFPERVHWEIYKKTSPEREICKDFKISGS